MGDIILLIATLLFFALGFWAIGKVDKFIMSILPFEEYRTQNIDVDETSDVLRKEEQ